jgi:hypothetical protein
MKKTVSHIEDKFGQNLKELLKIQKPVYHTYKTAGFWMNMAIQSCHQSSKNEADEINTHVCIS